MSFERLIAWRYLKSPRQEGFISVIAGFSFVGIMLGVATLIVVMAVMNGFRQEFMNHIIGVNGHIWVHHTQGPLADYLKLQQEVEEIPGVKFAMPLVERQAILTYRSQARGVGIHALDLKDLKRLTLLADNIKEGSLEKLQGNTICMGKRLAEKLFVRLGDHISLMTAEGTPTAFGTLPRQRSFEIVGLFEVGMSQFDQAVLFMPLETAQDFFKLPDHVTALEVTLNQADDSDRIKTILKQRVDSQLMVLDWKENNAGFMQAVKVERNVMFLILTLIILIAAFNIISSLIMLVKDKTRDIAILRTMGATKGSVMRIFVLTGATIGTVGTALGVVLGLAFATNMESIRRGLEKLTGANLFNDEIYFLSQLPAKVEVIEVVHVVAMALCLSFLATLYPAWRASRLDPIEALRQ